ncbi:hypothetical protein HBN50_06940 [Halobacteriovorax sp. GB3]|uniref:hypothetical protein n=1 Tax=Halobacteriovorax sp. GB3 TaxID=2719615 RepID=UPI002362DF61|nr:hypothetical protein [Halobacteriovorax sp. GB3]MDD0852823.1 hypothetical protein [Halobacteriovorax sp. GB3]
MRKISILFLAITLGVGHFFYQRNKDRRPASVVTRTFPDYFPDHIYLSLDEQTKLEGPIESADRNGEYMKRIFGLLVQSADRHARDDWYFESDGIYQTYNAFLLATLLVPYHESRYVHMRRRDQSRCSSVTNDSYKLNKDEIRELFKEKRMTIDAQIASIQNEINELNIAYKKKMTASENAENRRAVKNLKIDQKALEKEKKNILSNEGKAFSAKKALSKFDQLTGENEIVKCDELGSDVDQLLVSYDYNDIGIMMFNMKANPDAFSSGRVFSTKKFIDDGIDHLYYSFNRNAGEGNDKSKFPCLDIKGAPYYYNLIRSAWSNYNGGHSIERACRFHDSMNCLKKIYKRYRDGHEKTFFDYNYAFQKNNQSLKNVIERYEYNQLDGNIDLNSFSCRFQKNDWDFMENFVSFLFEEKSYLHLYLPAASLERKALQEIVNNVKNGSNKRTYIEQVLKTDYMNYLDRPYTEGAASDYVDESVSKSLKKAQSKLEKLIDDLTEKSNNDIYRVKLPGLYKRLEDLESKQSKASGSSEVLKSLYAKRKELQEAKAELEKSGIQVILDRINKQEQEMSEIISKYQDASTVSKTKEFYQELELRMLKNFNIKKSDSLRVINEELLEVEFKILEHSNNQHDYSNEIESTLSEIKEIERTAKDAEQEKEKLQEDLQASKQTVDYEGELPKVHNETFDHYISGQGINIRFAPKSGETLCGNTKSLSDSSLIQISIVEPKIINGYQKVYSPSFEEFKGSKCESGEAYVYSTFIKKILKGEQGKTYGIATGGVRIRTDYNRGKDTGQVLHPGERVVVLEEKDWGDPWYRIVTESGFEGWVWMRIRYVESL